MGISFIDRIVAPYRQLLETISRKSEFARHHMVPRTDLNAVGRARCEKLRDNRDFYAGLAGVTAVASLGGATMALIKSESNSDVVKNESGQWLISSVVLGAGSAVNLVFYAASNSAYRRKCLITTLTPAAQSEEDRQHAGKRGTMFRSTLLALDSSTINASAALAAGGAIAHHSGVLAGIGAKIAGWIHAGVNAGTNVAAAVSTAVFLPFFVPPPERSSDPTM